jgi:hypothetical protein
MKKLYMVIVTIWNRFFQNQDIAEDDALFGENDPRLVTEKQTVQRKTSGFVRDRDYVPGK